MLTLVEVRNNQGAVLSLPLEDISNGLLIEEIDGLDPVKATLVSSSFARLDGAQYHTSRREPRNIKLSLGFMPEYSTTSVRDLRTHLYHWFMPKAQVKLRFYMSDGLTVEITGRVETFESALFTKEPSVDISIMCFDPDFIKLNPVVVNGSTTSSVTETLITYDGTVETGIDFVLNVNRTLTEFTIYHRTPNEALRSLNFAASLASFDVLTIGTVPGAKGATLLRSGIVSSVLYGVSPQSNWIELQPGDNYIRVYATGAAVPFTLTYTERYGGL